MLLSHTLTRNTSLRSALLSTSTLTPTLSSRSFATKRRRRPNPLFPSSPSSSSNAPSPSSLFDNQSSSATLNTPGSLPGLTEAYAPKHPNGQIMTMEEYKEYAKLSPWVPCPDIVAKRMLEVAEASPNDFHVELGSGDGRLNFHAIDSPFEVKHSTGIDIDPTLVNVALERLSKRHPVPDNVSFLQADLLSLQKREMVEIAATVQETIGNSTVLTMYFVEEALQQIKPLLEQYLKRNKECRVVTCGYEMKGWKPSWVEVVLGLPIYLYRMDKNVGGPEKVVLSNVVPGAGAGGGADEMKELEELKPVRPNGDFLPKPDEEPLIPEGEDVDIDDDEDWDAGFDEDENEIDDGSSGGSVGGGSRGWKSDKR